MPVLKQLNFIQKQGGGITTGDRRVTGKYFQKAQAQHDYYIFFDEDALYDTLAELTMKN